MTAVFPLDLPGATALYLSLYVLTLSVHVVFMSYVLAGSAYVAVASLASAATGRAPTSPVARVLRDWLPFGLGAAITAGVAPLLFLQILYKESFYTANLLLFHRWMAMVPVLIIGFYLLYIGKSRALERWGPRGGAAVALVAFACFAFAAWSWTENHLLALDQGAWADHYAAGRLTYHSPQLAPRVAMWMAGAVPVMAMLVGWQLGWRARDTPAARVLALLAVSGLVAGTALSALYRSTLDELARLAVASPSAKLYLAAAALGVAVQAGAWLYMAHGRRLAPWPLAAASAGACLMVIAITAVREIMRVERLHTHALTSMHARVAEVGGMPVFFAFVLINAGVIAWCFRITRRGLSARGPR